MFRWHAPTSEIYIGSWSRDCRRCIAKREWAARKKQLWRKKVEDSARNHARKPGFPYTARQLLGPMKWSEIPPFLEEAYAGRCRATCGTRYAELFARRARFGWDYPIGDQALGGAAA